MSGQVPLEIERKFLLQALPEDLDRSTGEQLRQGYLCNTGQRSVRIREKAGEYFWTCKAGKGVARREAEIAITAQQFEAMWGITDDFRVVKTRYLYPLGVWTAELDVFEDNLAPMMMAEVEFTSQEAAEAFEPPAFFGPEVTTDPRFLNATLAECGLPSGWQGLLVTH